ncbi:MAG: asparaginase domain-containing protein [Candidatus Micrarchaeota archaeon]
MAIRIFITGGTIDDLEYSKEQDAPPKTRKSIIPDFLKTALVTVDYKTEILFLKDSKFITNLDRKLILDECTKCKEEDIIITHGTMSMVETAKFLGEKKIGKTILLVGSAVLGAKPNSDALFNLGAAFSAVQILKPGVYITMNGKIFSWGNVKKNLETGHFEFEKESV